MGLLRLTAVTMTGAAHAPMAPMKKTVWCELKFVAVATAIGSAFPSRAKRRARFRCLAL